MTTPKVEPLSVEEIAEVGSKLSRDYMIPSSLLWQKRLFATIESLRSTSEALEKDAKHDATTIQRLTTEKADWRDAANTHNETIAVLGARLATSMEKIEAQASQIDYLKNGAHFQAMREEIGALEIAREAQGQEIERLIAQNNTQASTIRAQNDEVCKARLVPGWKEAIETLHEKEMYDLGEEWEKHTATKDAILRECAQTFRGDEWLHRERMEHPLSKARATLAAKCEAAIGEKPAQTSEIEHVCGLSGFGQSIHDECPACRRPKSRERGSR